MLDEAKIPYFISKTSSTKSIPLFKLVYTAYNIISTGYKREDLLTYAKCGLIDISRDEVDRFELYCEKWGIEGRRFSDGIAWNMNPRGYEKWREEDEAAIAETQKKYGTYCRTIAELILSSHEDAEECVNDAYRKAWDTIPPRQPASLASYMGMLTRQLSLNRIKQNHRQKRGGGDIPLVLEELQECISDRGDVPSADDITLRDALNRFLGELPKRTRVIFMRRYWFTEDVARIAADFGVTEGHVNVLLYRTRKKLKQYLEKEGIYL
jgi:RNA polymerase sigma-70 factor (ECF subfamily)